MVKLLFIDNYDSFTYNLVAYCQELGASTEVYTNDSITLDQIYKLNPDKILISPGPGTPDDAGISLDLIAEFYNKIPILGVCLGHQCLVQYFGGKVIHAARLMHGKTSEIHHNNSSLFSAVPNKFKATRYHSLIADNDSLPSCLTATAFAYYNQQPEIMALEHKKYLLYGVQFHPEAVLSEYGHDILRNFLTVKVASKYNML